MHHFIIESCKALPKRFNAFVSTYLYIIFSLFYTKLVHKIYFMFVCLIKHHSKWSWNFLFYVFKGIRGAQVLFLFLYFCAHSYIYLFLFFSQYFCYMTQNFNIHICNHLPHACFLNVLLNIYYYITYSIYIHVLLNITCNLIHSVNKPFIVSSWTPVWLII